MKEYRYVVTVMAETAEQAKQVMDERIMHDEDYGFEYEVTWIGPVVGAFREVSM